MKKLICALFVLLLLVGCGSNVEESESVVEEESSEEVVEESEAWVYEGVPYDQYYAELGKADVDLSEADGVLADVLAKGQIVMATSPDYPPSEFIDVLDGSVKGADVLVGKYIANSLGVELVIETMDFGAVLTSLDTGKSDIALSGFGYKEDRAEVYELSHGYQASSAAAHHTILVNAADVDKYNSLADFAGKTIDAQANSLQQMYCEDQLPDTTMTLVSTLDQAILELQTGKVDCIALDSTTAKNYAETSDGMFVSLYDAKGIEFDLSLYSDYAGNVAACKKGETSLINVVNQIIDQMQEEGLYAEMYYAACDAAGVTPDE